MKAICQFPSFESVAGPADSSSVSWVPPTKQGPTLMCAAAGLCSCFSTGRVEVIECDPWFCVESVESRRRAALVDVAVRSKSEALLRLVAVAHITLPSWSAEQLEGEALETFGRPADEETGLRQQLSVLMREAGACEWLLDDYFWHPGIRQARIALRRRMLCAAIEQFPHLGAVALVWAKRENGNAEIQIDMVLG